jgi:outer membrane protein assembly factor BamE (lipoprotein component of BamABCDE complex)
LTRRKFVVLALTIVLHTINKQGEENFMKNIMVIMTLCITPIAFLLGGCVSAQKHYEDTHGAQERAMTVGIVQKEIKKGMSGADVASILGSPNIVTTDAEGLEVWVYDKISTDVTYSQSSGGGIIGLLVGGGGGNVGGGTGASGNYNKSAGAASTTQRTLTVVIKFDNEKKVKDFSYHSSQF